MSKHEKAVLFEQLWYEYAMDLDGHDLSWVQLMKRFEANGLDMHSSGYLL